MSKKNFNILDGLKHGQTFKSFSGKVFFVHITPQKGIIKGKKIIKDSDGKEYSFESFKSMLIII